MSENVDRLALRLSELRQEFDRGFARPIAAERRKPSEVLCFTAEGARFAVALTELQALAKAGTIVQVPSRSPALLGLTVVRARLMPVYSVAQLTGSSRQAANTSWLGVLRGTAAAALAIDSVEGYADRETASEAGASDIRYVMGAVRHQNQLYALLDGERLYAAVTHPADLTKGLEATP